MLRYFDAFVYSANWCSCRLSLRFPRAAFNETELNIFANVEALSCTHAKRPAMLRRLTQAGLWSR